MICCPVLLILLKGRGIYYLFEGISCLVAGISYAVPLLCMFLNPFHIPLSPIQGTVISIFPFYSLFAETLDKTLAQLDVTSTVQSVSKIM